MPSILCVRNTDGPQRHRGVLADFDRNGPDAVQTLREPIRPDMPRCCATSWPSAICCGPRWETARRTRAAQPAPGAPGWRTRSWQPWSRTSTLHGQDAIATLRTEKPQAWARLVGEVCQFRLLPKTPKPAPRREPRPVRMKSLIQALSEQPVDPTSALLPMTQAQALPDALAAVPRGTWPQPVEVWRQAFGEAWDDALAHWLAIHLPGSIVLPEDHDPGERSGPKPEAGSGAPAGDWLDAFRAAGQPDEAYGDGFVMRRR